jgi:hypothetical protein
MSEVREAEDAMHWWERRRIRSEMVEHETLRIRERSLIPELVTR